MEEDMPTFILTINWTDQGIRAVRDAPKRSQAARELAKKVGVEIKEIYLTSGEHDLLVIAEAPLGDLPHGSKLLPRRMPNFSWRMRLTRIKRSFVFQLHIVLCSGRTEAFNLINRGAI
jgi:hypothetical protein